MDVAGWVSGQWQFVVGTIIAILGIVIGVAVAWKPKSLDYAVVNDIQILWKGARNLKQSLSVKYADRELSDPRLVTVRIRNTGKRAVRPDDFDEPITIKYKSNPPFSAQIVDATAPKLGQTGIVFTAEGIVTVNPLLMNPSDAIDIQMMSDGRHGPIVIESRIADARNMKQKQPYDLSVPFFKSLKFMATMGLVGIVMFIAGIIMATITNLQAATTVEERLDNPWFILTLLGMLVALVPVMIATYPSRRRL